MALTAADFLRPTGRLKPDWFTDDIEGFLAARIAQVEVITPVERAQRAWVYSQAYGWLVDDLMIDPAYQSSDDVTETRTAAQLRYWITQRDASLEEFRAILGGGHSGVANVRPVW